MRAPERSGPEIGRSRFRAAFACPTEVIQAGVTFFRKKVTEKKAQDSELEKYIAGIIWNNRHKKLAIGAMPGHIHIFVGYNVNQLIPVLVETIKTSSNLLD